MPGNAQVVEVPGQPQVNTLADFSCALVGYSSTSAVTAGKVSPAYSKAGAAASDMGAGDMVDCATQMLSPVYGATTLPPVVCYTTPATTPGSYGTLDHSAVTGTCIPINDTSVAPTGTHQVWIQVRTGFTVGTTGGDGYASLDGGRTKRLVAFGTSTRYDFPASDGWGVSNRAGVQFGPASATLTALRTKVTLLQTTMTGTGHFTITSGSPAVHSAGDTADDTALAAVAAATTPATCIALFNACKSYLGIHGASAVYHTGADTALATALAAIPDAATEADVDLHLPALIAAYNAHRVNTTGVHGSADSTNTITSYTAIPGTLIAGDVIQTNTIPPQWSVGDLYTAASGPTDATGAMVELAKSPKLFGRLVITEPMAAGDFSTIQAGLDYALSLGKRWRVIARFRDPDAGESDAAYITAFQTFVAACLDSRFTYLAGNGLMSDAFSGRVYLRTFMAAYLSRLQSMPSFPGMKGERLAQNAGWVDRGPLPDFSLRDADGLPVGHDEAQRGGIVADPGAPTGGGMAVYYQTNPQRAGTYIDDAATVAYPVDSTILTPQDRDVANALESTAVAISLGFIGGADIIGDGSPRTMDPDIAQALEQRIAKSAKDNYGREFANPDDPNLVTVDETVIVTGSTVDITGDYNVKFYAYGHNITLRFKASR